MLIETDTYTLQKIDVHHLIVQVSIIYKFLVPYCNTSRIDHIIAILGFQIITVKSSKNQWKLFMKWLIK